MIDRKEINKYIIITKQSGIRGSIIYSDSLVTAKQTAVPTKNEYTWCFIV